MNSEKNILKFMNVYNINSPEGLQNKRSEDAMLSVGIVLLPLLITLFLNSCCYTKKEYYSKFEGKENLKYIYETNRINGKKCGKFVWLSEKGDTIEISSFQNDKLNGVSKFFFENGNIQIEVECLNDKFHGTLRENYKNGQLRCELIYEMDRLWEIKAVYDSTGNILNPGKLKEGNGFVKIFYPNGQVQYKGAFDDGVRSGYWKFFTESGSVIDSIKYQDGYREGSITIENTY